MAKDISTVASDLTAVIDTVEEVSKVNEQRKYDQESLESDLEEMSEFLKLFSENVRSDLKFVQGSLNILHQEVSLIKTQFCHPKEKEPIDNETHISAPRIDPKFLQDIDNEEKPPIKTIANSSNIMMTSRLEPKLANFHFARMSGAISTNLEDGVLNIIHWLAPEKMHEHMSLNAKKRRYTQQCEIFSFGMMLWELCFEKVPYHGKDMGYITNHVTKGGREKIPLYSGGKEEKEKEIYTEFIKIIKMAWAHDPDERISIGKLYIMLSNMHNKYVPPGQMPDLLPNEVLKLNEGTSDEQVMSDDEDLYIGEDEDIKESNDIEQILEDELGISFDSSHQQRTN
ncbi:12177_t:CDS:2 [Gigaspora rosea]|nr:12177_t:CDS:2 [Gigaspora rosea]